MAKSSAPAGVRPGKLAPPELPAGHLARAELERRLDEAAACRVTTVVAGPGFGKSTLVAAWAHDREHAWYGLDGADASPALLARGLATALERVVPGLALASFTERTRAAGNADRNAEAIAAQLADLLAEAVRRDVVLVLDDLQELPVEGAASRLVAAILRSAPPVLHVVLCSREQPPFGLARLRGQGQVASLAADTLAFSEAEVEALLDAAGGPELATLAQHVYELTGGWPAAVRLAAEAMRGQPTLGTEGLERGRLSLFAYLAEEVFGTEPDEVRELLRRVAPFERFTVELCADLGVESPSEVVGRLLARGLFLQRQGGWLAFHTLAREFALETWPLTGVERRAIHRRAAAWFERGGFVAEALAAFAAAGEPEELARLLAHQGPTLLAAGAGDVVLRFGELLHEDAPEVGLVVGEAYALRGELDRALGCFERAAGGEAQLPPELCWRMVAAHVLRDSLEDGLAIASRCAGDRSSDTALLKAWTSSAQRRLGRDAEARAAAADALELAEAVGDDRALATAHLTAAMALSEVRRDWAAYEAHLDAAQSAAERASDVLVLIRIRNNRASLLIEECEYERAIAELDAAIELAEVVGFAQPLALAVMNRGLARYGLGRLDEAAADYRAAIGIYRRTRSREIAYALVGLGDVYRERGQVELARAAYEEGLEIAEEAGDRQGLVPALYQLAKILVTDEPASAARLAERAVGYGWPDPAWALNASGWVALARGAREQAFEAAERALAVARERRDRYGLAESLELRALAAPEREDADLDEAHAIWHEIGNELRAAACTLARSRLSGDEEAAADAERTLGELGVRVAAHGPAGLLRELARVPGGAVAISTLGGFHVRLEGRPVPLAAWQSKRARDLLKILVAHRGRPVPRDLLMETLWPGEDPVKVAPRLSVALSTVRAVLDPGRSSVSDRFVRGDRESVALDLGEVTVDVERFLVLAEDGLALRQAGAEGTRERLEAAERDYAGDFLEEDAYEEWAIPLREEARSAYMAVVAALAEDAAQAGDHEAAVRYALRVLERDAYDERSHLRLVTTLDAAGRHGDARRAYRRYVSAMEQIGVEPAPYP